MFGYIFRSWPGDKVTIKPIRASAFQHDNDYFVSTITTTTTTTNSNDQEKEEDGKETKTKKSKKNSNNNNYYDTIVIGSGSGGCACANLLSQSGQKVLVLEQHVDRTGGCTHTFRDNNCEWDTGLHVSKKKLV